MALTILFFYRRKNYINISLFVNTKWDIAQQIMLHKQRTIIPITGVGVVFVTEEYIFERGLCKTFTTFPQCTKINGAAFDIYGIEIIILVAIIITILNVMDKVLLFKTEDKKKQNDEVQIINSTCSKNILIKKLQAGIR